MQPTPAELARTAVAQARVGTLTTFGRRSPSRPRCTVVSAAGDGADLVVRVRVGSPAAVDLLARPLASVQLGPSSAGHAAPVVLAGGASRLPGCDAQGRLAFRVQPGAVRVGAAPSIVLLQDYLAADPDPLAADAPRLLQHLAAHHVGGLRACLRAHGHGPARWVEPTGLDRHGLSVASLDEDGVTSVRLPFGRAVSGLDDLPTGLRALLLCRCEATRT